MLDAHGRRLYEPMAADRIRELARIERFDGPQRPTIDEVDFMIAFERRYGGLWYRAIGSNGIEHGLDAEATLYETELGLSLPAILDGDWTWRVSILTDGRTMMDLGRGIPPRVIDSSVEQRLEHHAMLAAVRTWPHQLFSLTLAPYAEPEVRMLGVDWLLSAVPEATGPANRWWFDGKSAMYAHLSSWWGRPGRAGDRASPAETWTIWCFSRDVGELAEIADRLKRAVVGMVQPEETWCMLCSRSVAAGSLCYPDHT